MQRSKEVNASPIKRSLHDVVEFDNVTTVETLINDGEDIDAKDLSGDTPLHLAAIKNSKKVAQLLIDKKANPEAKNNSDWTPLHCAANNGNIEIVKLLLTTNMQVDSKSNRGETALHRCAFGVDDSVELVKLLMDHGANVEAQNDDGWTPLHSAAKKGNLEIIKHFLNLNVNCQALTYDGKTPAQLAEKSLHHKHDSSELSNLIDKHAKLQRIAELEKIVEELKKENASLKDKIRTQNNIPDSSITMWKSGPTK